MSKIATSMNETMKTSKFLAYAAVALMLASTKRECIIENYYCPLKLVIGILR